MKICLIAEGSYPYITGGVSSWIQTLIENIPEHEFIIYAIGAEERLKGHFKYQIPQNVREIKEVFLDSYLMEETTWGNRYRLSADEKRALKMLFESTSTDWTVLFDLFSGDKIDSVSNFLTSKDFFDIIQEVCLDKYSHLPFTDMFWTLRSMVLSLFQCIAHPVPEADLYHSVSTGYAGVIGSLAAYLYQKPYLITEHGIYTREREEEIIKADWVKGYFKDLWIQYFYNMSNCAYQFSDQVISLFEKNREIQVEIGCPIEKTKIVRNGINLSKYQPLQEIQQRDDSVINIGAIVRVVPIKDIRTMLQAFAIVKTEIPNAVFYIMGPTEEDSDYYNDCLYLLETLGTHDVIFTGEVNIKEYIRKMDVLVLTSISEGQPLAILEGMASEIPYVSTDVGSCKELLLGINDEFGEAGIIAPVMHYTDIANAIIKLAMNRELRERMGKNGRRRVSYLYTEEQFIDNYKHLYQTMMGESWLE